MNIKVLVDPSGNAVIENPHAPRADPIIKVENYKRSHEENSKMGYAPDDEEEANAMKSRIDGSEPAFIPEEVMHFDSVCPACNSACSQNMKTLTIPYFKEVIIMALSCDKCGYRDNEVKSSGGICPKGKRYSLSINSDSDLKRDLLKTESATVKLPDIELETLSGTLNDRFTTVEGLLQAIYDDLSETNPFVFGDSTDESLERVRLKNLLIDLKKVIDGQKYGFKFILDDPAGNCYIQNLNAPAPDPLLVVEEYERSHAQNDDLGLLDMNTKDFETIPTVENK
ncbi:hypothetical protein Ciccas_008620 [Cichlidogyrus casuarinus]|uniref:Zinc finger ZPR1-type domain-containing protein n=1 Tax=Cichlidogyrus casuarinus TaxID=1844966 RepID=A0ABD2PZT4_9PLAT